MAARTEKLCLHFAHTFSHLAISTLKIAERERETERNRDGDRWGAGKLPGIQSFWILFSLMLLPFVGDTGGQDSVARTKNSIKYLVPIQVINTWVATENNRIITGFCFPLNQR